MTATLLHNQSLLDFAIQHTGDVLNVFPIAKANSMAVSDQPEAGTVLMIPDDILNDTDILNYYASKEIKPATSAKFTASAMVAQIGSVFFEAEGISYWAIYDDFIIQ